MSLANVRPEFVECPSCNAKPGSPELCRECVERRELYSVLEELRRKPLSFLDRLLCSVLPPAGYIPEVRKAHRSLEELLRICPTCNGTRNVDCKEHGR